MAEQSTEVGLAYYDGWQKQLADLRAENSRLSAEVEELKRRIVDLRGGLNDARYALCGAQEFDAAAAARDVAGEDFGEQNRYCDLMDRLADVAEERNALRKTLDDLQSLAIVCQQCHPETSTAVGLCAFCERKSLSAEVERMRGVLGDKPMNIRVLSEAERKQARNESGTVFKMGVYIDDLLSQLAASRAEVARLTAEFKQSDDAQARLYRSENCEER